MTVSSSLKARLVDSSVFARVQGAVQLSAAMQRRQFASDTAYVMLAEAHAEPNGLINAVSQKLIEGWSVLYWIAVANDALGDAAADAAEARREQVIARLLGFAPDADHSPLTYVSGQLVQFEGGAALWEDRFSTDSYLRATS